MACFVSVRPYFSTSRVPLYFCNSFFPVTLQDIKCFKASPGLKLLLIDSLSRSGNFGLAEILSGQYSPSEVPSIPSILIQMHKLCINIWSVFLEKGLPPSSSWLYFGVFYTYLKGVWENDKVLFLKIPMKNTWLIVAFLVLSIWKSWIWWSCAVGTLYRDTLKTINFQTFLSPPNTWSNWDLIIYQHANGRRPKW